MEIVHILSDNQPTPRTDAVNGIISLALPAALFVGMGGGAKKQSPKIVCRFISNALEFLYENRCFTLVLDICI